MAPEASERQPGSLREGRTGWAEEWMAECKQLGFAGGQQPLREGAGIRAGLSWLAVGLVGFYWVRRGQACFPRGSSGSRGRGGAVPGMRPRGDPGLRFRTWTETPLEVGLAGLGTR